MTPDAVITNTSTIDDGVIVHPAGEIDFSRSPNLRQELINVIGGGKHNRLVINLAQVEYMDSSGVATLVEAMQEQTKSGGKLVLCCLQPKVASIFQISRLDMVFTIVDDEAAAASA